MQTLLDIKDWKRKNLSHALAVPQAEVTVEEMMDIYNMIDRLEVAGFMRDPVGITNTGVTLSASVKTFGKLEELLEIDFSNCYIYAIYKFNYKDYKVDPGRSFLDYSDEDLEKLDYTSKSAYRIRYADPGKLV